MAPHVKPLLITTSTYILNPLLDSSAISAMSQISCLLCLGMAQAAQTEILQSWQ